VITGQFSAQRCELRVSPIREGKGKAYGSGFYSLNPDCGRLLKKATGYMTTRATVRKQEMSKQSMRDETERLVKEALERKALTIKQGQTRIETKCGKCGAPNRVSVDQGQVRVPYTCKECGEKQLTF
jgi:hypothetical protein